jgi:hypothetical protein
MDRRPAAVAAAAPWLGIAARLLPLSAVWMHIAPADRAGISEAGIAGQVRGAKRSAIGRVTEEMVYSRSAGGLMRPIAVR